MHLREYNIAVHLNTSIMLCIWAHTSVCDNLKFTMLHWKIFILESSRSSLAREILRSWVCFILLPLGSATLLFYRAAIGCLTLQNCFVLFWLLFTCSEFRLLIRGLIDHRGRKISSVVFFFKRFLTFLCCHAFLECTSNNSPSSRK